MDHPREHDIEIARLIGKETQEGLNEEERAILDDWLAAHPANRTAYEELRDERQSLQKLSSLHSYNAEQALFRVKKRAHKASRPLRRPLGMRAFFAIAASLMIMIFFGWWVWKPAQVAGPILTDAAMTHTDASPAQNQATLVLVDGRTVSLSDQQEGIQIEENRITYLDGTLLQDLASSPDAQFLTIHTPRGGQYHITLPDRTQVWLNAESTLKYPMRFAGTERRVTLEGEAYFSVTKTQQAGGIHIPFVVQSGGQEVTVLGTEFNINTYQQAGSIATTLIEGSVQVRVPAHTGDHSDLRLLSGEQSIFQGETLYKQNAQMREVLAWREGRFVFQDTPLEEVLHQLARWYNVEIAEDNNIPDRKFTGDFPRLVPLSEVLRLIKMTSGLTFELQERRLQLIE